jgi:hypothetical protein
VNDLSRNAKSIVAFWWSLTFVPERIRLSRTGAVDAEVRRADGRTGTVSAAASSSRASSRSTPGR